MHRFTQNDTDILYGVMLIDVEIAASFEIQVEGAVARHKFEHVIEETNAGADMGFSPAVEIEMQTDIGFRSVSMDAGLAIFLWHQLITGIA